LVVSTDTLVAGVHFPEDTPPSDIGYKALAVNLSDLAAMGATPAWVSLALTLPSVDESWLADFAGGFFELAARHNVQLIGGDTTRGALSITVHIQGFVPTGTALTRTGARVGDRICVTGTLGDAALALQSGDACHSLSAASAAYLLARLRRPTPRIDAGIALRGVATSAIDISDGLAGDLGHVLAASGVGATLEIARLPLSPALCSLEDKTQAWRLALAGGDDYELCFTVPEEAYARVARHLTSRDCVVTSIGRIESALGLRGLQPDGGLLDLEPTGYRHF
jgi:thiamine-monophosphate kinase